MSLFGILSLTQGAMTTQTGGLSVAGENVSNASVPGYVKRVVQIETVAGSLGSRFIGVKSARERFAHDRVTVETGRQGAATARANALTTLQGLVAPGSGAIGDRLNDFFAAAQGLVSKPDDPTSRAEVLSKSRALASAISGTAASLTQERADLLGQSQSVAGEVNERLKKIAELSQKIEVAHGIGDDASALRDERDRLVDEVSDRVGGHAIEDDKGHFTLFGAGGTLVDGSSASSLAVDLDPNGNLAITLQKGGGIANAVNLGAGDGRLGGLREARDVDVPKAQAELDQFAFDFTAAVNSVHSAGFGLDGVSGRNLFAPAAQVAGAAYAMKVDPAVDGQPNRLAASASINTLPGGNANAVALLQLQGKALGNGTPAARVAAIVAGVGSAKASADDEAALRDATVAQAKTVRDSMEGVNVDEEMVDLTRYQRAYESSLQVMKVTDSLLESLIGMVR
jgi:flagellar hook-associated protein 1 FlgK